MVDSGSAKLVVTTNVFSISSNTKLKLISSYSLNMSSLNSSATAEINVVIVHAKHEDLSLQKTRFSTKFGSSSSSVEVGG